MEICDSVGGKTYPELSYLIATNQHLPPHIQGGDVRDIRFVELDIPRTLADYTPFYRGYQLSSDLPKKW